MAELDLSRITYVGFLLRDIVDANNSVEKVLKIGHETSKGIKFHKKVMYTAQKPDCETYDFDIIKIDPQPWNNYTNWLSKNSVNMFDTDFMILDKEINEKLKIVNFTGVGRKINADYLL